MRSLLAIVGLAALLFAAYHFYGHSFDPKPISDKLSTPILNPQHPDIQESARVLNHVEDGAREKIEDGKRLKDDVAAKAKDAGLPVDTK